MPSGHQHNSRGANYDLVMQFDMMESEQMVQDMICVYNSNTKEFHTVVRVGRDVCGCAFLNCVV